MTMSTDPIWQVVKLPRFAPLERSTKFDDYIKENFDYPYY
jgi:hypothetical protein